MQNQSNKIYRYRAFGLTIESGIKCPELVPVQNENPADVQIHLGNVPECLVKPKKTGVRFQAKPNQFLLKVDNIARYYVSNGSRIMVEKYQDVKEEEVRLFLLGSAVGALLHQRGMLPIHSSAIKVKDKCVAFCGASGSGKSTIAGTFIKRGYDLHADDICVVSVNNEGIPLVAPGYPQIKLWEDMLIKTGGSPTSYKRVRQVLDKFGVPAKSQFNKIPLPLKKIYVLCPSNRTEIEVTEATGMEKFNILKNQTYRFQFIEGLETGISHFKTAGVIGNQVPISRVQLPRKPLLLYELTDLLEKDFLE